MPNQQFPLRKASLAGSRACSRATPQRRPHRFNHLRLPNSRKVVKAAAAKATEPVVSPVRVARKAVATAAPREVKAVDVGAVDAVAMVEIDKAVRSVSASTPKANPCWRKPIHKAQTQAHQKLPARKHALSAALVPNAVNAPNVAMRVKLVNRVNRVNPAKAVVDGVAAMAVHRVRTVRHAAQTLKADRPHWAW